MDNQCIVQSTLTIFYFIFSHPLDHGSCNYTRKSARTKRFLYFVTYVYSSSKMRGVDCHARCLRAALIFPLNLIVDSSEIFFFKADIVRICLITFLQA
jgi:hypothetical protein